MSAVAWFLQIPPNPRTKSNTNNARSEQPCSPKGHSSPKGLGLAFPFGSEQFSFLFGRGSLRPAGGEKKPQQKRPKTVSWGTDEFFHQTSRPVRWNMEVQVFVIPARGERDNAPDESEDDEHTVDASCEDDAGRQVVGSPRAVRHRVVLETKRRSRDATASAALETKRDTVG